MLVFGGDEPESPPTTGLDAKYLGRASDESLIRLYSAADVFVCPSMEENFGQTALESLACGTPVVAFDIGGLPDMVEHERNGYLARPFSTDDLANGISWIFEDDYRRRGLSEAARKKVEQVFAIEKIAHRYASLYQELLDRRR